MFPVIPGEKCSSLQREVGKTGRRKCKDGKGRRREGIKGENQSGGKQGSMEGCMEIGQKGKESMSRGEKQG